MKIEIWHNMVKDKNGEIYDLAKGERIGGEENWAIEAWMQKVGERECSQKRMRI